MEGTIGGMTFYCMGGQYYVRMKSSLTGDRWRKDKAFARSRENALEFGGGSRVASAVWQAVPKEVRKGIGLKGYNRLAVAFRRVIAAGDGVRGARAFRAALVDEVCGEVALGGGCAAAAVEMAGGGWCLAIYRMEKQELVALIQLADFEVVDGRYVACGVVELLGHDAVVEVVSALALARRVVTLPPRWVRDLQVRPREARSRDGRRRRRRKPSPP